MAGPMTSQVTCLQRMTSGLSRTKAVFPRPARGSLSRGVCDPPALLCHNSVQSILFVYLVFFFRWTSNQLTFVAQQITYVVSGV